VHAMIGKFMQLEDGFMDNVVTLRNPPAPHSLADRIKAASG